jgi:hypothetical protein
MVELLSRASMFFTEQFELSTNHEQQSPTDAIMGWVSYLILLACEWNMCWAGAGSQLVSCLASQISCAVLWKHGTWTPGQLTAGRFQGGLATRDPRPAPGPRIGRKPTQRKAGVRFCGGVLSSTRCQVSSCTRCQDWIC